MCLACWRSRDLRALTDITDSEMVWMDDYRQYSEEFTGTIRMAKG